MACFTLSFKKPVRGHVLRQVLKHGPRHVFDRHVNARHVPKHILARDLLRHVFGHLVSCGETINSALRRGHRNSVRHSVVRCG